MSLKKKSIFALKSYVSIREYLKAPLAIYFCATANAKNNDNSNNDKNNSKWLYSQSQNLNN